MVRYLPPVRSITRITTATLIRITAVGVALLIVAVQTPPAVHVIEEHESAADVVIAIDATGSMRAGGRWDRALDLVSGLVAGIHPDDTVSVITFDTLPTPAILRKPAAAITMSDARRLPATPTGPHTDLGAALEYGVNLLSEPTGGRVGALVLLTDGRHEPDPYSAFLDTVGAGWDRLRDRAAELQRRRPVVAAQLTLSAGVPDTVSRVFHDSSLFGPDDELDPRVFAGAVDRLRTVTRTVQALTRLHERDVTALLLLGVLVGFIMFLTRTRTRDGAPVPAQVSPSRRRWVLPVGIAAAMLVGQVGVNMGTGGRLEPWSSPWWVGIVLATAFTVWAASADHDSSRRPNVTNIYLIQGPPPEDEHPPVG